MLTSIRERLDSRDGLFRSGVWPILNVCAMLALAACGGGGGGGSPSTPNEEPPPSNAAPAASAGEDQTIQLPTNSVELQGAATDDGPNSALTYAWTSDPAEGVSFANAAAAVTTATFAAAGTYTLTLTVSDGALSGADTVVITVQPAAAANQAPVVAAGEDQTIQLPTSSVELQGSATDDDPNSALTYAWTSEPAEGVSFANAAAAVTTATFAAAGTYTLTLTVSDGELSGADSITITVQAASSGEDVYPAPDLDENDPDRGWTRITPAEAGMDVDLLAQAQAYAEAAGGSGMIVRGGRLVHSWGNIDERFASQSATKSIGGMALGLAIDDGLVALEDLASTHLPSIGTPPANDPAQLATITLLQLATHTAGFEKSGGYGALLFEPGTTWSYSDGGLNWLADLLTTVYAQDLRDLLSTRVWHRLGLNYGEIANTDDVAWRASTFGQRPDPRPDGIEHRELASGIATNANAMARVGLLFLRNGVWSDGRILSESFVETVRTSRAEIAPLTIADPVNFPGATTNYGVLWWTNATGLLPNVPTDAYWAWGQYDSLIVVIPSLDLVVSRIGPEGEYGPPRRFGGGDWNADYSILAPFLDPIVQSIQE
ncbi:MAG: serine hydrolase [Steroidobacteraceae bacterium]|jgi:CubicO group peptidase (beta-lactamase class C family)|nr:serine hydrolase [Steroidobacteraceae bacterium]